MTQDTDFAQRLQKESDAGFSAWMRKPETKLLLSMLPGSTQPPELVATLLRSAFDAGAGSGQSVIVQDIVRIMLCKKDKT